MLLLCVVRKINKTVDCKIALNIHIFLKAILMDLSLKSYLTEQLERKKEKETWKENVVEIILGIHKFDRQIIIS